MEIGINNKAESPKTAAKGAAAGALAAGAYHKAVKPAYDSFIKSINNQQGLIEKVKAHCEKTGQSIENYVNGQRTLLGWVKNPEEFVNTATKLDDAKVKNLYKTYSNIVPGGTDKAFKNLKTEEKLLASGKPSKLTALKDTAVEFTQKTGKKAVRLKDKFVGFATGKDKIGKVKKAGDDALAAAKKKAGSGKECVVKFLKIKNKGKYISDNKDKIVTTLKKGGKVLAPLAAGAILALGIKSVLSKSEENA